ncbi:hypothetical protein ACFL34_03270 [Candidatus Sumerlaeota bacterium]
MESGQNGGPAACGGPTKTVQASLKFNIIYIPGMTKYLKPFVASLLSSTDCEYRLVANGCFADEQRLLASLCEQDPRLEYFVLSADEIIPHDKALSLLQQQEESDYFCFLDSDVFSKGNFLEELAPYLGQCSAVFSAPPLWCRSQDLVIAPDWPEMYGQYIHTSDGLCLGCSFFAIYDNRALTEFVESTGITFSTYNWHELPPQYQDRLIRMNLKKRTYDTGKVLNILLQDHGKKLLYVESPSLFHLGSMTAFFAGNMNRLFRGRFPQRLSLRYQDFRRHTGVLRRRALTMIGIASPVKRGVASSEFFRMVKIRAAVSHFFLELLRSLATDRPFERTLNVGAPEVERNVQAATEEIKAIWKANGFAAHPEDVRAQQ